MRAGADLGLLAVAGVAYWQLDRQTSGAVTGDTSGTLGIDPLLVAAPALALSSLAFGLWYAAAAWSLAPYPF